MAKSRTVSLVFKNSEGQALPPVSFVVNDGEQGPQGIQGEKGDTGDAGPKGDNANLNIEAIIPDVKGGETSFPIGTAKVIVVQINGLVQPQGYAYTVEGTNLLLAEALKNTDFISIEVTE
ncbi:hypothetical protein AB7180_15490 [Providencia rettgeri]